MIVPMRKADGNSKIGKKLNKFALPGYNSFRYHMELMQKNICNKLSFNYFYRFFNRNLMICKKTAEQVCHDFDQFLPLNAVVERLI